MLVNISEKANKNIIIFYRITFHLVAIYPTTVPTPSDLRTRHYPHSYSYRFIQTTKDSNINTHPRTISQWNLLPVAAVKCRLY